MTTDWATTEPATHDYTRRYWGHDYTYRTADGGQTGQMSGWGNGIRQGDYLLLENRKGRGGSSRYRIDEIRYEFNPSDMWHATVTFAPRVHEEGGPVTDLSAAPEGEPATMTTEPAGCPALVPSHGITASGIIRCGFPPERQIELRCSAEHVLTIDACGKHAEQIVTEGIGNMCSACEEDTGTATRMVPVQWVTP